MIIHQDGLLVLHYEPSTDILIVKWPDLLDVPSAVIEHSFSKLIQSINNYHITKLLLDSRGSRSNVPDAEYKPLALQLIIGLAATRLQKIARLISNDQVRETRAKNYSQEVQNTMRFTFKSQEFEDQESALAWLTSNESGRQTALTN